VIQKAAIPVASVEVVAQRVFGTELEAEIQELGVLVINAFPVHEVEESVIRKPLTAAAGATSPPAVVVSVIVAAFVVDTEPVKGPKAATLSTGRVVVWTPEPVLVTDVPEDDHVIS
jgi:hypothetical protein